jgi:hypothetical protein
LLGTPIIVLAPSQNLRHRMFRADSSSHGFAVALHRQVAVPLKRLRAEEQDRVKSPAAWRGLGRSGRLEDFVVVTRDRTIEPSDAAASGTG